MADSEWFGIPQARSWSSACNAHILEISKNAELSVFILPTFHILENNILGENTLWIAPSILLETLGTSSGEILWRSRNKNRKSPVWVNDTNPSAARVSSHICLTLPVAQPRLLAGRPVDMYSSSWRCLEGLWNPSCLSRYLKAVPSHRCTGSSMQMSLWTAWKMWRLSLPS